MYELAGIVCINPDPFTLRELEWMARGKQKCEWGHTSNLCYYLVLPHKDKDTQLSPQDFNPFYQEEVKPIKTSDLSFLANMCKQTKRK